MGPGACITNTCFTCWMRRLRRQSFYSLQFSQALSRGYLSGFLECRGSGLTDIKVLEVQSFMIRRSIAVVCLQETHISQSPYYKTEDGFLVICSGSASAVREHAGVGFIIALWVCSSLIGLLQYSNRIACLKLRVPQGKIAIIATYAPHSGYSYDIRQGYFEELENVISKTSVNGLKLVCGDFNAILNCSEHYSL